MGPDGGVLGDGGVPPLPDGGCASYGQVCTSTSQCCNGVPCTFNLAGQGRCEYPIQ